MYLLTAIVRTNNHMPKRCPHNREQYRCRECGGFGMCDHGREKRRCKNCEALTGIAVKKRNCVRKKNYIVESPNDEAIMSNTETQVETISPYDAYMTKKHRKKLQICQHNNQARNCRLCPGPNICEHQRYKYSCKRCQCEHKIYHNKCPMCRAPWKPVNQLDGTEIDTSIEAEEILAAA